MTREDLEHIIRACATITNQYEFVIVGSQSILGVYPNPPAVFTVSAEADIYPLHAPELWEQIDGAIGEGSRFHDLHGFYAQGVDPTTAKLPNGWIDRVHRVQNGNTDLKVGLCLDPRDLFLSKAYAGRDKDREFCSALLEYGYVTTNPLLALVEDMPIESEEKRRLRATIRRWAKTLRDAGHAIPDA